MKTNKNGVKLLAAIMALAMVLVAGFVIIGDADDSDAAPDVAQIGSVVALTDSDNSTPGYQITIDGNKTFMVPKTSTGTTVVSLTDGAVGASTYTVKFVIQNGQTLTLTTDSNYDQMIKFYSATVSGTTILVKDIAGVEVSLAGTATASLNISVTATATSYSGSATDVNGTGSITVVKNAGTFTSSNDVYVVKVSNSTTTTYYSNGAVPSTIGYEAAHDAAATVVIVGGKTVDTLFRNYATGVDNRLKIDGTLDTNGLTITLAVDGSITVTEAATAGGVMANGYFDVQKGQVKTADDTFGILLTAATFKGVTSESSLASALINKTLYADIEGISGTTATITNDQYIYNKELSVNKIIIDAASKKVSFQQGSSFSGTVLGRTIPQSGSHADGQSVTMAVDGSNTGRYVTVANAASDGTITITAQNTVIKAADDTTIIGSEFSITAITQGNAFSSAVSSFDAVVLSDGFKIQAGATHFNLDLSKWTVIIPKNNTINLMSNKVGDTTYYAKITLGTGDLYVFGDINGTVLSTGNITATGQKVYWTKENQSVVSQFTASGNMAAAALSVAGPLTGKDALYTLTQAQEAGYDISETVVNWGSVAEVSTTDDGESTGNAVDISLDAYKKAITAKSGGTTIHVVAGTTFTVSNETILEAGSGILYLDLKSGSELVIKDSNIMMEVTKDPKADVKVSASVSSYDNPNGSISIGYMREFIVSGNINGSNVTVYGKLTIDDKAKLSSGSTMDIKKGGDLTVNGQFDVEGDINFLAGSTGTINGTMNIGTANGGSVVTVTASNVTVSENGTVKVVAPNNRAVDENVLVIDESQAPIYNDDTGKITNGSSVCLFTVGGTLDVRGTIAADLIYDKGTITINGKSGYTNPSVTGTNITIFDGVTLTVGSVNGTVVVTDDDIMGDSKRTLATLSDGNQITLQNITGVTVSESVSSKTYTSGGKDYKLYICDMTVGGALGIVKDTNATAINMTVNSSATSPTSTACGKVEIFGDMVLGKYVDFVSNAANLVISGTVTCIAEDASMVFNSGSSTKVTGTITVKTEGDFSDGLTGETNLSAAEFIVTDITNGTITYTYTNFEAAIAEILNADEATVTIYGTVKTTGNTDIPKDSTVDIEGTLSVSKDSTVVAKAGSNVVGEVITVSGTFTTEDYKNDLDVREVSGDVVSVSGDAKTWTSLANALSLAAPGSVIIASKDVTLSSSVTIPKDVAVETEYDVTVKKNVVLTVAGSLTLTKGTIYNDSTATIPDVPGKLIVTGTGSVAVVNAAPGIFTDVSGAHFQKLVGAKDYYYVSNIDYAVSAVDEKLEDSLITIVGEVDVGEVTFAKTEKMDRLFVTIAPTSVSCKYDTIVSGNIKLVGANLTISDDVKFSGTVTASANGSDAKVAFEEVSGFFVSTFTDNTSATPVDYMLLGCAFVEETFVSEGKVATVSGTVTVGNVSASTRTLGYIITYEDFFFTVGEGSTLQVLENSSIDVNYSEKKDKATFVVDGDLIVKKGSVYIESYAIMDVNGSVTVSETVSDGIKVYSNGTLNVAGTVTVSDEAGKEGDLSNYGVITVGSKPTDLGAAGTIVGKTKLYSNGYVLIYSGEVGKIVSSAGVDAKSTDVSINGVEYVTIVGTGDVRTILDASDIDLTGIDGFVKTGANATKIYSDEAMTEIITGDFNVGDYKTIYFELDASDVAGLVSVGTGIEVFIDGAKYANGGIAIPLEVGTHTVDYNIITGYDGKDVKITFNGQSVAKGGKITITADMKDFSLIVTGAVPSEVTPIEPTQPAEKDDSMGITEYLLIVLVILAAILVVVVAIRMMRS